MSSDYQAIKEKLQAADAIIVTVGEAFSVAEGVDVARAKNVDASSEEIYWGQMSAIVAEENAYTPSVMMQNLQTILEGKDYFIVTQTVENHFERAGFDAKNIYEVAGSWKKMQCIRGCDDVLYDAPERIEAMKAASVDGRLSTRLVPYCPICGAPIRMNVAGRGFIPNHAADKAFNQFANQHAKDKVVVLELGLDADDAVVKAPVMNYVRLVPEATLVSVNEEAINIPEEIEEKSMGIQASIADVLAALV